MSIVRPRDGDRVLWIRFSAFGDVLQSAASACAFKRAYPGVRLTFLTRSEYGDILGKHPYIDDLLCPEPDSECRVPFRCGSLWTSICPEIDDAVCSST